MAGNTKSNWDKKKVYPSEQKTISRVKTIPKIITGARATIINCRLLNLPLLPTDIVGNLIERYRLSLEKNS